MTSEAPLQEKQETAAESRTAEPARVQADALPDHCPPQAPVPQTASSGEPSGADELRPPAGYCPEQAAEGGRYETPCAGETEAPSLPLSGEPSGADELRPPAGPWPEQAEEEELSFAEMLAKQESEEAPQSRLAPGQRVVVRIVAITGDTIFVSTGSKVDGIVDREELEVDGELPCQVGDLLDLYVVTVSPQEVKLSKILRGTGSLAALEAAKDAGLPVEGKVTAQVKGGYAVDVMKRRAFCPLSQIDLRPLDDAESVLGKSFPFLITRLEKGGRNIVVSRRTLLEREQAENRDALLSRIQEGDVIEAAVSRL